MEPDIEDLSEAPCLKPCVPSYGPVTMRNMTMGETKLWCTCGLSKKQPWCDNSHKGTRFRPLKWTVGGTKKDGGSQTLYSICNCKYTMDPPYCDASHIHLPLKYLKAVKECEDAPHDTVEKICDKCGFVPGIGGVKTTILFNPDGSLVAFAGGSDNDARKLAAVASNVWVAYERHTGEGLASRRGMGLLQPDGAAKPASLSPQPLLSASGSISPSSVVGPTGVPKDEEGLRSVMILCEMGKLSIASVSRMLLCLIASEEVEFGMLKAKTRTLKEYLEAPLDQIAA
ncbi:Ragulator complex protein lamtor2 [Chytriomyces hyalinus]|nr:Ragulator complex protein lamtor2 [Chytriomyces hyalinus]